MARTTTRNNERLELRLPADLKELAQTAAELSGQTLTGFVMEALRRTATDLIQEQQQLKLSRESWEHFNAILQSPPALTAKFHRAAQRWRELGYNQQYEHADPGVPGSARSRQD